jgi:hypothetical protein
MKYDSNCKHCKDHNGTTAEECNKRRLGNMAKKATRQSAMREAAKKRADERQQSGGGGTKFVFPEGQKVTWFKPEKGPMKIDIIPYEVTVDNHPMVKKGEMWFQRTIWVHNAIGAEEKSYLCLKTVGKKCPICEEKARLSKRADSDEDIIKALTAKEREIYNVIDLSDKKAGVQLWEYSYHLFGKLLETEIRENEEDYSGFAELEGGYTLKLRFKEKQMGKNKFLEVDRIDFTERDDYDEDILEDVLDLDTILNVLPYDKLLAVFDEVEDEEPVNKNRSSKDDEDDEDDEPKSRKKKAPAKEEKPKRKAKPEPEDDEEDDEEDEKPTRKSKSVKEEVPKRKSKSKPEPEDDEDDEEDEKPAPKKSKSSRKPEPEDDEEDDEPEVKKPAKKAKSKPEPEDDEEEDDEPPKKSKGKKKSSDECPIDGGTFGTDCDEFDECFDCEMWTECKEASDAAKPPAKKKK